MDLEHVNSCPITNAILVSWYVAILIGTFHCTYCDSRDCARHVADRLDQGHEKAESGVACGYCRMEFIFCGHCI